MMSSRQGHRNYVKAASKTDIMGTADGPLNDSVGQSTRVNTGRKLLQQNNNNVGVLSGRIPETFATLDALSPANQRRAGDTHRNQDVSKNLFGSPTHAKTNTNHQQTVAAGLNMTTSG